MAPARAVTGGHADAGPGLVPEEYVLANPALNYAQFLLRAVLPTVLHVVIAISAGFAVGSEFRRRSLRAWWDISGHSVATALVGKLLPYYVVLMLMFVLMVGILDVWLGVSFRGSALLMAVSATLLIVAYQMIGCLMQLLARNMALGLSLTGLIVSPAFGYAGVGFPVLAMGAFPRAWGAILPLRWYIQILFDQASRGAARHTAEPFASCAASPCAGVAGLVRFAPGPARPGVRRGRAGRARARRRRGVRGEWRRVLRIAACSAVRPGAALTGFYPQPYLGQIVRNVPIAVVDQDNSELGRGLIQTLQAHGNIRVALLANSYREAEDAILARRAFAILGIPADTEKNVLKGVTARLPIYADSTYFILFNRALQGMLEAVQAYAMDALTRGARSDSAGVQAATRLVQPVELVQVPLFNPTASYSSYVVPAAFVLILHQTLLMGAAMLGGVGVRAGGRSGRAARCVAGRDPRARSGALDDLSAGDAALLRRDAARVRLFDTGQRLGARRALHSVHPGDELPGAGARPGVPPSRDGGAAGAREQPAAVLPGRRVVARGGTARYVAAVARTAAERECDRRDGADQPDGGEPGGSSAGLGASVGAHVALFCCGRGLWPVAGKPDAAPCRRCLRACAWALYWSRSRQRRRGGV